ncbi:hypothetical protein JOD63_001224 [Microbacterium terrae]|uniref:3-methyladenine DNA glycosylase n=1 Tax=Microbacterium terrae TaxID=69369 RepID=A0A0M2HN16_9MICO|nr:hypothetical protein RS81_00043 [Microbacterium terrae]MBP1077256.1 hypothetical protein [Microbacterium terrae]
MHASSLAPPTLLVAGHWRALEAAHIERALSMTSGHRDRAARGEKHPVEDFLFTYYSYKPSLLTRWHPGAGVELADAAATDRAQWRWYQPGSADRSLRVDTHGFSAERSTLLGNVERILRATADRAPQFGCFGLHEWAMVYRQGEHRHPIPLRLGQADTDAVVEAHDLKCTHFDAFRFFTAEAVPLNREPLTRDLQPEREQAGCLHAGMDLYKWAVKLGPLLPGDVLLDAFALSSEIRVLDMQASPYDLADHGYEPVRIETAAGKAEYVRRQRAFAERAQTLRERMLAVIGLGA